MLCLVSLSCVSRVLPLVPWIVFCVVPPCPLTLAPCPLPLVSCPLTLAPCPLSLAPCPWFRSWPAFFCLWIGIRARRIL